MVLLVCQAWSNCKTQTSIQHLEIMRTNSYTICKELIMLSITEMKNLDKIDPISPDAILLQWHGSHYQG